MKRLFLATAALLLAASPALAQMNVYNPPNLVLGGALTTTGTGTIAFGAGTVATLPAGAHSLAPLDNPTFTGQTRVPDGTAAAPGMAFTNELGAGIYHSGAGTIGFAAGGVDVGNFGITFGANTWVLGGGGTFVSGSAVFGFANQSRIRSPSDGLFTLLNNAETGFTRLNLGGTTSSFPSIKRNATALNFRLADDSADATITAGGVTGSGVITFSGVTTGTNADFVCMAAGGVLTLQTTACTISSMRFKDLLGDYRSGGALATVAKLEPIVFKMKPMESPNADINYDRPQIGLSAENVAAIEPRCAVYEDDGTTPKSYRQECLIAVLVAGMQAQQREIEALKAR